MDPLWAGTTDVSLLTELLLGRTRGSTAHGHCHGQMHERERATEAPMESKESQEADL